jgi:hypothetical protein
MIGRKNRMVSFRLSSVEYELYRGACVAAGVRSLSELARAALQQVVDEGNGKVPVEDQLRDLRENVQGLSTAIRRLAQKLDGEDAATGLERAFGSTV